MKLQAYDGPAGTVVVLTVRSTIMSKKHNDIISGGTDYNSSEVEEQSDLNLTPTR